MWVGRSFEDRESFYRRDAEYAENDRRYNPDRLVLPLQGSCPPSPSRLGRLWRVQDAENSGWARLSFVEGDGNHGRYAEKFGGGATPVCFVPPLQGSGDLFLVKSTHRSRGGLPSVARRWRSALFKTNGELGDDCVQPRLGRWRAERRRDSRRCSCGTLAPSLQGSGKTEWVG